MRKTKTVTIKAASLDEARAEALAFAKAQGLGPDETKQLVDSAQAETPGRDEGKTYLLTEMGVFTAEKWAARALLAMSKAGLDVPGDAKGVSGLFQMGLENLARVDWREAEPLMDEMISRCAQRQLPAGILRAITPANEAYDDVEELGTMLKLRKEILDLHFDFFSSAENSISATKAQ